MEKNNSSVVYNSNPLIGKSDCGPTLDSENDPRSPRANLDKRRVCPGFLTLMRTEAFILCKTCNIKHTTMALNCVKCG